MEDVQPPMPLANRRGDEERESSVGIIMNYITKSIYGKKGCYLHKAEIMGVGPAKRIGRRSAAALAMFAVMILCFTAVSALPHRQDMRPDSPAPASGSGRDIVVEDKLYFHRHNQLTPQLILNTTPTTNSITTAVASSITFTLQTALGTDVEIIGKDDKAGGPSKGMWLEFLLAGVPNTDVTISILQDNATVARGTTTMRDPIRSWSVPFTAQEVNHVFPSGCVIKIFIECNRPTSLTYNTTDSYLLLPLSAPPVSPQLVTSYEASKPTTEFHPYWPDSVRRIRTEGDIATTFGPNDVGVVQVTIRSPSGDIVSNSTAQLSAGHYVSIWNYSRGQTPGNYNVTVKVTDRQSHEYLATTVITMLQYASYISSKQTDIDGVIKGVASPPRGGSEKTDAKYALDILNSGFSATSITVRVSSDPPPGWTASLSSTSIASIMPGTSVNITFTVSAGAEIDYGSKAVIYVEAIADGDTRTPKASWTVQTVTNATMSRNFDFSIIEKSESWIDVDQTVNYQMLLRNKGILDMNITLAIAGTPVAWSAQLDVPGMVRLGTGSASEKTVNLKVTAPAEEVGNLSRVAQIAVTAQAVEDSNLEKTITTVTHLITILSLQVTPDTVTSDPDSLGGRADIRVTITNLDPTNIHTVRLTVTAADWPISSLKYDPKESLLSPNGATNITVSVTPPAGTLADEVAGYTVSVKIEPLDQPTRSNSTTVKLKVRQKYAVSLTTSNRNLETKPGEKMALSLTVTNLGNGNDNIKVYVAAGIPQDWQVHLNDVLSPPNSLTLQLAPGAHADINMTIKSPDSSRDGTGVNVTITAMSGQAKEPVEQSIGVKLTVKKDLAGKLKDVLINDQLGLFMFVLTFFVIGTTLIVWRRSKS